jgi:hypothetical protein
VYEIIQGYFEKLTGVLPVRVETRLSFVAQAVFGEFATFNDLTFSNLNTLLQWPNYLLSMFGYRIIRLLKGQFDIAFISSKQYDK